MPIDITCDSCFKQFKVADRFAGRKGRCPDSDCQAVFRVPQVENDWTDEPPRTPPRASRKPSTKSKPANVTNSGTWKLPVSIGAGVAVLGIIVVMMMNGESPNELSSTNKTVSAESSPASTVSTQIVAFEGPEGNVNRLDVASLKNDPSFEKEVVPFLKKYCFECHEGEFAEEGVQFDLYKTTADVLKSRKKWEKILSILEIGAMPPSDADQPTADERLPVLAWLDNTLYNIDCEAINDPGRETIQRLNLAEYTNTIRDLFGIDDMNPGRNFPADDVGEGFDNIGDVLSLPSLLMEKYLAAAEEITLRVIVDTDIIPVLRKEGNKFQTKDSASASNGGISFPSKGTATTRFKFAKKGDYILRVSASATQAGRDPAEMGVYIDEKPFKLEKIKEHNQPQVYEYDFKAVEGDFPIAVSFLNDFYDKDAKDTNRRDRNLFVNWVELEGPLSGVKIDPPEHHKRIVIAEPGETQSVEQAATKVFDSILPKVFRRPVQAEEVQQFVSLVKKTVEEFDESYEAGIRLGLQAALVSPSFLFRVEADPRPDDPNFKRELDDFELASRLSYFLWSSMPDDELLEAARKKQLKDPKILEQQVRRMLAHPKSNALVDNFGGQWLNLRNLDEIDFDRRRFKTFDDNLRRDMITETLTFFDYIVREDRSILDFLNADYTFVNERLAKHYGIEEIKGKKLQKVSLEGTPRSGVLTQSSILALTSNPTRTSPVKRGKWIMDNILGTPPPPPPPGVPELEETAKASPDATLTEQLALHREDPGCASCHNQMDPLGLAFERFDAVGQFREREGKKTIDDSGVLPDGQKFAGAKELIEILSQREEPFTRNLTEKMLTYALGRGLIYYDRCAIDEIITSLENDHYKFSRLVLGVVNSAPFRMRRGDGGIE
ncbi:MAG: DUF1592 domain-containing protein [Planctomycetaceae bacterium]|nr:DUF1592 domain-containing protein [Planctomycetaceae bacterium]